MYQSLPILKLCLVLPLIQLISAGSGQHKDESPEAQWPCPMADEIVPCVCTWDDSYNLFLDCSAAKTVEELSNAFNAQFPFENFYSLTIDQEGCNDCSLTSLPAGVLGNVVTFKEITIAGTQIAVVEEQVFSASHDTLVTLRLSSNVIRSFPEETVGSYKALKHLYLNANNFSRADPIHSLSSEQLLIISLSSNDLSVEPDFVTNCPAIKYVRLRNTKMTAVPIFDESPIGMFTGLQQIELIDLGANLITEIQTNTIVAEAKTLKTVDFDQNNISILHPNFVSGFASESTVTLNMSTNSITTLDQAVWEDILSDISHEQSVDISGNPLVCGCDMAWLVSSPLKNYLTYTTTCERGTPIQDLDEAAFEHC